MSAELNATTARDALEAVWEALSIPYAATVGEEVKRHEILNHRVMHAVVCLEALLGKNGHITPYPEMSIAYLREKLAEHPAEGYRTWDEAVAELKARQAGQDGAR